MRSSITAPSGDARSFLTFCIASWITLSRVTDRQARAMSFGSIAENYDGLVSAGPAAGGGLVDAIGVRGGRRRGRGDGAVHPHAHRQGGTGHRRRARRPDARGAGRALPGVRVLEGSGESIPLPDRAADAVFVSAAWHWMDPERAVPEIGRVLRDGGRFGLIWTSRDRDVDWVRDLDLLPGDERTEADAPNASASSTKTSHSPIRRSSTRWPARRSPSCAR